MNGMKRTVPPNDGIVAQQAEQRAFTPRVEGSIPSGPLKDVIERSGLSDQDISELFDASVPTVQRWRHGESSPSPAVERLVRATLER